MTPEQLERTWNLALTQYMTIDKAKCHRIPPLVQGVFWLRRNRESKIVPFHYGDTMQAREVREALKKFKVDFLGVSFVQHYITYDPVSLPPNDASRKTPGPADG